jgi:hypothetical protein
MKNKPTNHDRTHYNLLVKHAKSCGLNVKDVPSSRLNDYAGMNPCAAKKMGYKKIGKKEILIDKELPLKSRVRNLRHELIEYHDMSKGKDYFPAHKKALVAERKMTPWEKIKKRK